MSARVPFRCIDVAGAEALVRAPDTLVLDVRDARSFARGRIEGARIIREDDLAGLIASVSKDRPVLIYCYHGHASRVYAQTLSDFGFRWVYSLDGGYQAWSDRRPAGVPGRNGAAGG